MALILNLQAQDSQFIMGGASFLTPQLASLPPFIKLVRRIVNRGRSIEDFSLLGSNKQSAPLALDMASQA